MFFISVLVFLNSTFPANGVHMPRDPVHICLYYPIIMSLYCSVSHDFLDSAYDSMKL